MESETGGDKKRLGGNSFISLHLFVVLKFYIMSMMIVIMQ